MKFGLDGDEAVPPHLASIIISSYNYGQYLSEAIESGIRQSYPHTEVIVVDDGSMDISREIIASYSDRIVPVLKENGGQASALNAGFRVSRGDILLFVDSDDILFPTAVERVMQCFREPQVTKVHWRLVEVDAYGAATGRLLPEAPLSEGNLRDSVIAGGLLGYSWPPTSGSAWSRTFIERIFPMPEEEFRTCPDGYLSALAPLFGEVRSIKEPQGAWRRHEDNYSLRDSFDEWINGAALREERAFQAIERICRELGINIEVGTWRRGWRRRLRDSVDEISTLIPRCETIILVDNDQWGAGSRVGQRCRLPFVERDGQYWGPPADDVTAIRELERLRKVGSGFIIFAWPAFWWLDYYAEFHRYLRTHFSCLLQNDRLVIFDLRSLADIEPLQTSVIDVRGTADWLVPARSGAGVSAVRTCLESRERDSWREM